jgi:hypothetical protein
MRRFFLIDDGGKVFGQYFWNGSDELPANARSTDGVSDVQNYYRDHLTWTEEGWTYDGPSEMPVEEVLPQE